MAFVESKLKNVDDKAFYSYMEELRRQEELDRQDAMRRAMARNMAMQARQQAQEKINPYDAYNKGKAEAMYLAGKNDVTAPTMGRDQLNALWSTNPLQAVKYAATSYGTTPMEITKNIGQAWDREIEMMKGGGGGQVTTQDYGNQQANAGYTGATGADAKLAAQSTQLSDKLYQQQQLADIETGAKKEMLGAETKQKKELGQQKFEQEKELIDLRAGHEKELAQIRASGYNAGNVKKRIDTLRRQVKFDNGAKDAEIISQIIDYYEQSGIDRKTAEIEVQEWYARNLERSGSGLSEEEKIRRKQQSK